MHIRIATNTDKITDWSRQYWETRLHKYNERCPELESQV